MKTTKTTTKKTTDKHLKQTSVYLRRFGIVSESSELYENVNVLNMPELVRPALNKLMQLDTYSCELFIVIALDKKVPYDGSEHHHTRHIRRRHGSPPGSLPGRYYE